MKELLLLAHVIFGVTGTLCAGAIALESYLTRVASKRMQILSVICLATLTLALVFGGFWYLAEYPVGKQLIKSGPMPWAHAIVMESKEHLFFILYLAALILPFAVLDQKRRTDVKGGSGIVISLGVVIFSIGMLMEGMGGIISMAVRVSMGGDH